MTVEDQPVHVVYASDGSQLRYVFPFRILDVADLEVRIDGVLKTINTHYTVKGAGEPFGGEIALVSAAPRAAEIELRRNVRPLVQVINLTTFDGNPFAAIEQALDRIVMAIQELKASDAAATVSGSSSVVGDMEVDVSPGGLQQRLKASVFAIAAAQATELITERVLEATVNATSTVTASRLGPPPQELMSYGIHNAKSWVGKTPPSDGADLEVTTDQIYEAEVFAKSSVSNAILESGGGSPLATLVHTLTVHNLSASPVTTPLVEFGLPLAKGLVDTATETLEVRKADGVTAVTTQLECESTEHTDGSLNQASIMFEGDSLAGSGSQEYKVYAVSGSKDTTFRGGEGEADSIALITSQTNYRVICDIDGTQTWEARLNDLFLSGSKRLLRSGPVCRRWVVRGPLTRQGADHPTLWARFYVTLYADGTTITVFPQVINGYVTMVSRVIHDMEVLDGGNILKNWTNLTQIHHSIFNAVEGDGRPFWNSNEQDLFVELDTDTLQLTPSFMPYYDSSVIAPLMVPPSVASYVPGGRGDIRASWTQGGDRDDIGPLSEWSSRALIGQNWQISRRNTYNALSLCSVHIWAHEQSTYEIPIFRSGSWPDLGSVDRSNLWFGHDGPEDDDGGWRPDESHAPEILFYEASAGGQEWWHDLLAAYANWFIGEQDPGYGREDITIGGTTYQTTLLRGAYQQRAAAWMLRSFSNAAWAIPDNHPAKAYLRDMVTEEWAYLEAAMTTAFGSGGLIRDEARALGLYHPLGIFGSSGNALIAAPWQQAFQFFVTGNNWLRGYASTALVTQKGLAMGMGDPAAGGCGWVISTSKLYYRDALDPSIYANNWGECGFDGADIALPSPCPGSGFDMSPAYNVNNTNSYTEMQLGCAELAQYINALDGTTVVASADAVAAYIHANAGLRANIDPEDYADRPKFAVRNPL